MYIYCIANIHYCRCMNQIFHVCVYSLTEVWVEVMEEPYIQNKDKMRSITFPKEVKMCHVADVWKQAVELLWQKQY